MKREHERRKDSLPDNPVQGVPPICFRNVTGRRTGLFRRDTLHQAKGDARRHNVRDFRVAFHHWATALADAYGIDREKMIIRDEASGHLLIDECLALLFVVYIDPAFGVYLLERVDELLSGGFTVSDTWLVQAAGLRFTKEELTQILEQHETQHI